MSTTQKTKRRGRPATKPASVERQRSQELAQELRREAARHLKIVDALTKAAALLEGDRAQR